MFRRKAKKPLKEIEEWPTTLEGYGVFLNSKDQVRLISRPEEKLTYKVSNSMEYNDRRMAAFRRMSFKCANIGVLSNIAVERQEKLGMRKLRLPLAATEEDPHTLILVSSNFETNKEKLAILVHLKLQRVNFRSPIQMSLACGLVASWRRRLFTYSQVSL
jgi:hypothetical protein